jgi:predicted aminopeptidase
LIPRVKKRAWLWAGVVLALAFTGCHTISYYGQAIHGQFQIINRQRPIHEVLADPQTTGKLSNQLALVLELRGFAERERKLKPNGH